jgi:hypothetical protein
MEILPPPPPRHVPRCAFDVRAWSGFTYCLTYLFKSPAAAQNTMIFINVGCMFLILGSFIMGFVNSLCEANAGLQYVLNFLPSYALGKGLVNIAFLDLLPDLNECSDKSDKSEVCHPAPCLIAHTVVCVFVPAVCLT